MASGYKLRHLHERAKFLSQHFKIILITGARQVGKSTLLKNLFPSMPIITFDRITDVHGARSNPDLFIKVQPSPIILDEVQYVPELFGSIKRTVDESDEMGQYFLTGSHNLGMLKAAAESMAGRVGILDLEHFSPFEEFETFTFTDHRQSPPSWLEFYLERSAELVKNFAGVADFYSPVHAVWRGGFPALMGKPEQYFTSYFSSYLQTYVSRDAIYADPSTAAPQFDRFLKIMAVLTAQEINYAHFGRELGLKQKEVLAWEHVLKQTYQWREIPAYIPNALERVSKRGKGYFTDTGLACYLQGIRDPLTLLNHPQFGHLFETYCVNLVHKLITGLDSQPFVYHWRVLAGSEVDLLLHMNGKLYPIEIKATDSPSKFDARGILALRERFGDIVQHGIVLHAGSGCYALHEHVTALPYNALMKKQV